MRIPVATASGDHLLHDPREMSGSSAKKTRNIHFWSLPQCKLALSHPSALDAPGVLLMRFR
jgi:hypothetical protein